MILLTTTDMSHGAQREVFADAAERLCWKSSRSSGTIHDDTLSCDSSCPGEICERCAAVWTDPVVRDIVGTCIMNNCAGWVLLCLST
jgi:hypothetical protein